MHADALAVTIDANNRICGNDCPAFWPDAQVFRYVDTISFEARVGRFLATSNPAEWVDRLGDQGVVGFHVRFRREDQIAESFTSCGSICVIEAIRPGATERWTRVRSTAKGTRLVRTALDPAPCSCIPGDLDALANMVRSAFWRR